MRRVLIALAALAWCLSAQAEVWRYRDDQGALHYVDKLESVPPQFRDQLKDSRPLPEISKVQAAPQPSLTAEPRPAVKAAHSSKTVEIFVASWCPHCRALEKFLKEKQIRFLRYDIENDPRGAKLYKELGGGGIPIVRIGAATMRGFQPKRILDSLKD
jgi:glutaredoxin